MARGGRRAGTKGGVYTNRSDLRTGPLPISTPKGLPYGENKQLQDAQRAIPMGRPSSPAAPGPAAAPPSPSPAPVPGATPFLGPTMRPTEPVTAGIPVGPGPGPEVLGANQGMANDPLVQAAAALDSLGTKADAETSNLRDAVHTALANRAAP